MFSALALHRVILRHLPEIMIIELAGLPGVGKTTKAEELSHERGLPIINQPSGAMLVFEGFLGAIMRPVAALSLFMLILREPDRAVRRTLFINAWLGTSAKYWRARWRGIIDQGYVQAAFAVLPRATDFAALRRILRGLPRGTELIWCDVPPDIRTERLSGRANMPRAEFGAEAAERFAREVPAAYALVRRVYEERGRDGARVFMKTFGLMASYAVSRLIRPFLSAPEVIVLMYHAIDRSGWKLSVSPETFERQIKYLARKDWVVPLTDVVSWVRGEKKLPDQAVAITFDDGYQDVLMTVLPILDRYQIPVTVFIPSNLSVPTDPINKTRLSEEEIRILAQSPLITVGSHAKTHRKFTELSPKDMESELVGSADTLEQITGKRPRLFAYPFGARSDEAEQAVKRAGYDAAFSITEGTIHERDALFRLKRVQVDRTIGFILFRLRLTGAIDLNRRIVDTLRVLIPV